MPKNSRRTRRTRAQWAQVLQRFEASGLGPREFCRREGLALSSLQRWRRQVQPAPVTTAMEFVELSPPPSPPSAGNWTLELSLPNGVCLRLQG